MSADHNPPASQKLIRALQSLSNQKVNRAHEHPHLHLVAILQHVDSGRVHVVPFSVSRDEFFGSSVVDPLTSTSFLSRACQVGGITSSRKMTLVDLIVGVQIPRDCWLTPDNRARI